MELGDFEIKIKKYNSDKNLVIVNLIVCQELEIRGFTVRYIETKYSHGLPVWIVTPPSIKSRNKFFHIARLKNIELWQTLKQKIIEVTNEYVKKINI